MWCHSSNALRQSSSFLSTMKVAEFLAELRLRSPGDNGMAGMFDAFDYHHHSALSRHG